MTKPIITKRSVKGAALTYTELDDNFQNLKDATVSLTAGTGGTQVTSDLNGTITLVAGTGISLSGNNTAKTITITGSTSGLQNVVEDTTPQLGGSLDVNGFNITSTSNGNIILDPDGTGNIQTIADEIVVGNGSTTNQISIRPASGKVLNIGKPLTDNAWIQIEPTTGKIDVWTDNSQGMTLGSGPLTLSGYGGDAFVTTNSSSTKLYLKTNGTAGSAEIVLNAGTNADIVMVAYGTGKIYTNSQFVANSGLTSTQPVVVSNSAGSATIDRSAYASSYSSGAVVNFSNFSGMIMINRQDGSSGNVALWLCGGGVATKLGDSQADASGTISGNGAVNGYTWTNNTGTTIICSFMAFRGRTSG